MTLCDAKIGKEYEIVSISHADKKLCCQLRILNIRENTSIKVLQKGNIFRCGIENCRFAICEKIAKTIQIKE